MSRKITDLSCLTDKLLAKNAGRSIYATDHWSEKNHLSRPICTNSWKKIASVYYCDWSIELITCAKTKEYKSVDQHVSLI